MSDQPHAASRPPLAVRGADLEQLGRETWDVLIVGGGIVGCGALLDAASRGLRAALIEQDDIAVGTSSRSSRLIHGGLRYLEQFHIGLVREALHERARLLELAPHLVRLERFLFPLYGRPVVTRSFFQSGMVLYDLLGLDDRFNPRFLRKYADLSGAVRTAVEGFGAEVRQRKYPGREHSFE